MSLKTAIFFISASTFSLVARANLEGDVWVFHVDDKTEVRVARHGGARGTPLIDLAELAPALKLELTEEPAAKGATTTWRIANPKRRLSAFLKVGDKKVRTPFGQVSLTRAPASAPKHSLLVPTDIGDRVLRPLLTSQAPQLPTASSKLSPQVMIDPGHGGNDWGAAIEVDGQSIREKDLTLSMARTLKRDLERWKIRAALTRDSDFSLTLPERTRLANSSGAKVFLSLHINSEPSATSRGFELYVLSLKGDGNEARVAVDSENQAIPEDASQDVERAVAELSAEANFETSLSLAKAVVGPFKVAQRPHGTGVKTGPFYVLYGADMPALLIESAYLTQADDRKDLLDPNARARWTAAIAKGVAAWINRAK